MARWLASRGIAAFVLKYRLIQTPAGETGEAMRQRVLKTIPPGVGGDAGVQDALEALRIVRDHAAEWGIDPHRVGVVGFSAGGHVAGMTMFVPDKADRPDFCRADLWHAVRRAGAGNTASEPAATSGCSAGAMAPRTSRARSGPVAADVPCHVAGRSCCRSGFSRLL